MPPKAGASSAEEAVPVQAVAMKLMDVRLKPASAIIASVSGEFTAPGRHEIVFLRVGGTLEVQRIVQTEEEDEDPRTFLKLITRVETRSILRDYSLRYIRKGWMPTIDAWTVPCRRSQGPCRHGFSH
jgi:hypothetical protein